MDIGASIKKLRKHHGETQQQLGEAVGVVQQSVAAWESNRCMPDIASLISIASHYGTSTDYILGLVSEPSYPDDGIYPDARQKKRDEELAKQLPDELRESVRALIRLECGRYMH